MLAGRLKMGDARDELATLHVEHRGLPPLALSTGPCSVVRTLHSAAGRPASPWGNRSAEPNEPFRRAARPITTGSRRPRAGASQTVYPQVADSVSRYVAGSGQK